MGGDGGEREQRLRDLLATIDSNGPLSSIAVTRAAIKRWLITPRTAVDYADSLIAAGWVANKQGILSSTELGREVLKQWDEEATVEARKAIQSPPTSKPEGDAT